MTKIRRTQETGREVIIIVLDILRQPVGSLFAQGLRQHVELKGQHIGRLCSGYETPIRSQVLPYKSILYLLQQQGILAYILFFPDDSRGFDQQLSGMRIETLRDKVFVGNSRPAIVVIDRPVKKPVAKMKAGIPQI